MVNDTEELVDIREIVVDKALPQAERLATFVRQIKNPYRYKCGKFVVTAEFMANGPTLEECLRSLLA